MKSLPPFAKMISSFVKKKRLSIVVKILSSSLSLYLCQNTLPMFLLHQIDGQRRRWLCDKGGEMGSMHKSLYKLKDKDKYGETILVLACFFCQIVKQNPQQQAALVDTSGVVKSIISRYSLLGGTCWLTMPICH